MSNSDTHLHHRELAFGRFLRFWRNVHNLSQEELAFRLDCSPRHISRLENGSGKPSEAMIRDIAVVLELGQRDCNHLYISAGFAPNERKIDFYDDDYKWLRKAMMLNLRALDPYPSALLDRGTNILMVNRAWVNFFSPLVPAPVLENVENFYDFLFSEHIQGSLVGDWEDTISVVLMSLHQNALFSDDPQDWAVRDRLATTQPIPENWAQRAAKIEPMASFRVKLPVDGKDQRFFSVSSTVGALGPTAFASEPRLTLNTLYPEKDDLDMGSLMATPAEQHPLLYY